jgi:hypothetical protein
LVPVASGLLPQALTFIAPAPEPWLFAIGSHEDVDRSPAVRALIVRALNR